MEWILNRYQGKEAVVLAQVRRCTEDDLDAVYGLQEYVRSRMEKPELFLPDEREELCRMLQTGLCVGVFVAQALVGFLILRYCGEDEHNYAAVLDIPRSEWKYWANADSAAVHPDYRGNRLQQRMLKLAEEWRDPAIIGLAATVSPQNRYSLDNVLACGFSVAKRCEMYGGHDRYVLQKRLLPLAGQYRHFKGNPYQVLYLAKDSETTQPVVVYRALYGEREIWVRPAAMWFEHVERDGYSGPRFVYSAE